MFKVSANGYWARGRKVHMNDICPPIICLTDGGYCLPSSLTPHPSQELDITLGVGSNIRRLFLFSACHGIRLSWEGFCPTLQPAG